MHTQLRLAFRAKAFFDADGGCCLRIPKCHDVVCFSTCPKSVDKTLAFDKDSSSGCVDNGSCFLPANSVMASCR
ncbi:hypothetical protein HK105_208464 [Polyrhizophydium stewartii]|uniref:Uncharacterized protein n=1 Tax=Polyrhizophydium stewartii TaxID=2732419 RepID=A0ABR4MXQ0_9FUNG